MSSVFSDFATETILYFAGYLRVPLATTTPRPWFDGGSPFRPGSHETGHSPTIDLRLPEFDMASRASVAPNLIGPQPEKLVGAWVSSKYGHAKAAHRIQPPPRPSRS